MGAAFVLVLPTAQIARAVAGPRHDRLPAWPGGMLDGYERFAWHRTWIGAKGTRNAFTAPPVQRTSWRALGTLPHWKLSRPKNTGTIGQPERTGVRSKLSSMSGYRDDRRSPISASASRSRPTRRSMRPCRIARPSRPPAVSSPLYGSPRLEGSKASAPDETGPSPALAIADVYVIVAGRRPSGPRS
jgi:hypothetical protein